MAEIAVPKTPNLHRSLCNYYLNCLGRSARPEVGFFAQNKYSPEFAELSANPLVSPVSIAENTAAKKVVMGAKSAKEKDLFIGHIVFVDDFKRSKSGWTGSRIYPLLMTPIEFVVGSIDCTGSALFVNPEAIKKMLGLASGTDVQDAVLQLEEDLGLGGEVSILPSIDAILEKLRTAYSQWRWIEKLPEQRKGGTSTNGTTPNQPPLAEANIKGLYNRSILFLSERPRFTMGLETELRDISKMESAGIRGSALGHLLGYDSGTTQDASKEALIEPIPLNSEQRDAVQRALSQPLTVITGPPGTGKSQVVTSIIINAAMRGTTVLFSSKNNKAVDVVETRVNSLGQRPILLRLGTRDFQGRLSDYLTKLVSLKTEPEDEQVYESAKREYSELSSELTTKKRKIDEAIIFRNKVDDLENQLEQARSHLGEDLSRYQHQVDLDAMHSALNQLLVSIKRSDPKGQGWLAKLFPKVGKRSRQSALTESGVKVVSAFEKFSLTLPEISGPFEAWEDFVTDATVIEHSLAEIPAYFEQLRSLSSKEDMGQLARASVDLQERIADKSMTLWQAWLKTIPARLTPADRRSLTQFQSSVSMLAQVADSKSAVSLKQEQQRLFPYVSKFLPCWAVTSLSIRNRVPLTKSFFDLVVIDEASQCDIASALPLLIRAKRVVIIGDPLQLRHVSNLDISTDRMLLDQNNLMDSLEWAYSARSLFDLAVAASDSDSMVTLRDHHRSDAQIIEYSNRQFYDGQLRVATKHERLVRPQGDGPAIRWIDVKGISTRPSQGSVFCLEEAQQVVAQIDRLASQAYLGTVGVVTPFAPQVTKIKDLLGQRDDLKAFVTGADLLVATAHSFQGDERDVMVMSLALQPGTPDSAIKFISGQANLFNVAVTRARAALIVVGNRDAQELNRIVHIQKFVEYVDEIGKANQERMMVAHEDFGPKYPKKRLDEYVSDFEIALYEALYDAGIKTTPQLSVDQYRLDLALIDGTRRLDIEVDGEMYHRHWDGENVRRDILRSQRLIELGWDVQRFWVYQVRDDLSTCVERVKSWMSK